MISQTLSQPKVLLNSNNVRAWLPTLKTETPEAGYELAIHLSRLAVKFTQPSKEIRERLHQGYSENFDSLIAVSEVVAINFQTVAANQYWVERKSS